MKNRSSGDRWLAGTVTTVSGPVSYNVRLSDGRVWQCQQDQLRKRCIDTAENVVVDVPTGDSPPAVVLTMIPILLRRDVTLQQRPSYYPKSVQ